MVYIRLVQLVPLGYPGLFGLDRLPRGMGRGDTEGNCLPRGVIKTTFFGSTRRVGLVWVFFRR